MASGDHNNLDLTRRIDRAIRRERLRLALLIAGVAFLLLGIFAARPFGPPISNPVAIPKADAYAGLWLAQALPSGTVRHLGLALVIVGVILLATFKILRPGKSPNTSLELTRDR